MPATHRLEQAFEVEDRAPLGAHKGGAVVELREDHALAGRQPQRPANVSAGIVTRPLLVTVASDMRLLTDYRIVRNL